MITLLLWLVGIFLLAVWFGVVFVGSPYVPTLQRDLEVLFKGLKLQKNDHFVDLGAGDGKVLLMAARRGAQASGVELNPFLVWIARWRLRKYSGASVTLGDLWRYKLPQGTTYVFMFTNRSYMNRFEAYLQAQRTHTGKFYLISYGFGFKNRVPTRIIGAFNIYEF